MKAAVKVSRILPDLRSGAHKFGYREIRGPINLNNAPDISAGSLRGPEIYRDPPSQVLYFNHWPNECIDGFKQCRICPENKWRGEEGSRNKLSKDKAIISFRFLLELQKNKKKICLCNNLIPIEN